MTNGNHTKSDEVRQTVSHRRENHHRHESKDLRPLVPFYFYTPTIVIGLAAAIYSGTHSLLAVGGLLFAGWLAWSLWEYAFHRFVLHREPAPENKVALPGNATHLAHHKDPDAAERTHIPLHEGVPVAALFWLATWLITGSWQATAFFYTGFMVSYLFYEWLDYEAHHGPARSRLMRYYRKYHLQHHFADEAAHYGVTSPIFDILFGTYNVERKPRKSRANHLKAGKTV